MSITNGTTNPKKRNPVVLLHGINDTQAVFRKMSQRLQNEGVSTYALDLTPNTGEAALEQLAQQVADYLHDSFAETQPIDLVGFSMGGVIGRYYLQRLGGLQRVQRFVTISSPHQGTWLAWLRSLPGVQQMRPGSQWLQDLNDSLHELEAVQFTSLWTPFDLMIVPANSSCLGVGREIAIPVASHPLMLTDDRCIDQVISALSIGVEAKAQPDAQQQPCT